MLQRGSGLDLDHEALGAEHGGQLRLEDLDRDLAVVLEILRQVDRGHAAGAEFALDAVAIGQRGVRRSSVVIARSSLTRRARLMSLK